tara:strand:+ start:1084 stop:1209 length:126 start_codon:yes stop_codon:yes gene_type:complete
MIIELELSIQKEINGITLNIEGALFDFDLSVDLATTIDLVR